MYQDSFSYARGSALTAHRTSDRAGRRPVVTVAAPRRLSKVDRPVWSLFSVLNKASLAFSRSMTTWASAGRLPD